MKINFLGMLGLMCYTATAMPMMRVANGYFAASAATGTIGALLSADGHWTYSDANGEHHEMGKLGSIACGFLVGSSVPTAAIHSVYGLAKSGGAIYLFPNGDHANKIRVYRQLDDHTVRGWNGQQWIDVAFDAKQCANDCALKYGYKGTRDWLFSNPEIIKTLDASRK